MKKTLIILLLALTAGVSYGQFALGVRIGYNASSLTTDIDSIKNDFNSGFHVGAWAHLGKRIYLVPEIQYSMSGGVFSTEGNLVTSGWKQNIKVGSLDIPVLVGLKIVHNDLICWRVELGPKASFAINKSIKNEGLDYPIEETDINDANWYIVAGTGLDVLFLSLDVRYNYQLNQMIKDVDQYTFNAKNSQLTVSLGFRIFGDK